jgi:hypothetical protein
MRGLAAALLGLAVAAHSRPAAACSSCGCGDPTLTASGIEKPYRNRVRLLLDNRYGDFSLGEGAAGEHTWFLRTSLGLSWMPHPRVALSLFVPWLDAWIQPAARSRQTVSGLGDAEVAVRVVLFRDRGFSPHHLLWAGAGLKLPTGYRVRDDAGYPYSDDDQPGSGSWDPFASLTWAWYSERLLSAYVSTSYRQTTPGWHGNRRGSTLGASAALQLQPWPKVAFALGIDAVWQQADRLPNHVEVPNSGGVVGYVAPALLVSPGNDWLLRLVVDAPALVMLHGQQSAGTQVALSVAFDVK